MSAVHVSHHEPEPNEHRVHITTSGGRFTVVVNLEGITVDMEPNNDQANEAESVAHVVWADWSD